MMTIHCLARSALNPKVIDDRAGARVCARPDEQPKTVRRPVLPPNVRPVASRSISCPSSCAISAGASFRCPCSADSAACSLVGADSPCRKNARICSPASSGTNRLRSAPAASRTSTRTIDLRDPRRCRAPILELRIRVAHGAQEQSHFRAVGRVSGSLPSSGCAESAA